MHTQSDVATVAPVRAYFEALNGHDLAAMLSLFTDDAVLLLSEAETVQGAGAVTATYQARFKTFGYARELHIDEVRADADLAYVRCHSTGTFTLLATGQQIAAVARELFMVQRVAGGWRICCYMNNLPTAPKTT